MKDINLKRCIDVSIAKSQHRSIAAFSRHSGMHEQTILKIRRSNSASMRTLQAFCEHLGITLVDFIDNGK